MKRYIWAAVVGLGTLGPLLHAAAAHAAPAHHNARALARLAVSSVGLTGTAGSLLQTLTPGVTSPMASGSASGVTISVNPGVSAGVSHMDTGVTHEQYSLDSWGNADAVARGKALLAAAAGFQNQHIYGWGTTNPEPSPGVFDWSTLDTRVNLMRSMHARMVITLCCAPDWMTRLGTDTSTYPNLPPTPAHDADFANLARQIALRYPDVHYYQVWNEMKGLWNDSTNNWDYVAYTDLYNAVYDALKSVNPAIQVGGPYLVIEGTGSNLGDWSQRTPITARNMQVIQYWLKNKHGADFICLDRTVRDDHDTAPYSASQLLGFTSEFESIARQIRAVTSLPIWWAESYFVPGDWNFQAAGLALVLLHELEGGSAVSLTWQPQGIAGGPDGGNNHNLFSDTRVAGGGQPFPYYAAFKAFHDDFGPGTQLAQATSSSPDVAVLASPAHTVLVNMLATPVTVSLSGASITLGGYEVRVT
jgi:hypothetical protein